MNIAKFHFNPLEECCYLVWDETGEAAIVDPGFYDGREAEALYGKIQERGLTPKMILLTHGHFDHIYGVAECSRHYGIPVMMSADDKVILENNSFFTGGFGLRAADGNFDFKPVAEGDSVKFGNIELQVIATPGHTPGGVCWYGEKDAVLFSGDTLFAGAIGRTDNAWGDYDKMIVAIMDKLMGLDGHVSVLPGHGPESSIAYERTHNPFLQPFNEPGGDDLDWDAEGIELDGTRE